MATDALNSLLPVSESVITDWSQYGRAELEIDQVRDLSRTTEQQWGFHRGMFLGGHDDYIALRFFRGETYEPVTRKLWRILCARKVAVADVGAHSGVFTLDAFRVGACAVLSAEPHPINFARLVLNVRFNGFPVTGIYYGAVGERDGTDILYVKQLYKCHAAGHLESDGTPAHTLPVTVKKLDSLVREKDWGNLKVVKIDAERSTLKVLQGMGEILEHRPDLILECTMAGMDEILRPLGYKFWMIDERGRIDPVDSLVPFNPDNRYNGTDENCKNRFASVSGLP